MGAWGDGRVPELYVAAAPGLNAVSRSQHRFSCLFSYEGVDGDEDTTNELVVGLAISATGLANPESDNLRSIALGGNSGAVFFDESRLLVR